jgi:hypothetical protein
LHSVAMHSVSTQERAHNQRHFICLWREQSDGKV